MTSDGSILSDLKGEDIKDEDLKGEELKGCGVLRAEGYQGM